MDTPLDPYTVEKYYLLPAIDELQEEIKVKKKVGITHFLRYLKLLFRRLEFVWHSGAESYNWQLDHQDMDTYHLAIFIDRSCMADSPSQDPGGRDGALLDLEPALREQRIDKGVIFFTSLRTTSPFT